MFRDIMTPVVTWIIILALTGVGFWASTHWGLLDGLTGCGS